MDGPLGYIDKIQILSKKPNSRGPELRDVLAALTTINSHDSFDLERVETLGDAFLKFAASMYLYHKFPNMNEGQLTNIKGRLIGNRNLLYAGNRIHLGGRMKVEHFSPRKDFVVPGFFAPKELQDIIEKENLRPTFLIGVNFSENEALSGELTWESKALINDRYTDAGGIVEKEPPGDIQNALQCYVKAQAVSDKTVADCVEALIGTGLISGGIQTATKVLEWLRIIPAKDNMESFYRKKISTAFTKSLATEKEIDFLMYDCRSDIEKILKYQFKDPSLLLEAITHPSFIKNNITRSYERLEFLGDAILDFLITSHIYENYPLLNPGEITDLRSALVNNVTFASYVVKLGLHKYLCYQVNPSLNQAIMTFVDHQIQRDHEIVEDVLYLIYEDDCHLAEYVEVPKVLSDIFESLIGAIYLDSGGNLALVWSVIYRIMRQEIETFANNIPKQPVRILYEDNHACPFFGPSKIVAEDLQKVSVPVTITKNGQQHIVHGFGNNKFQAKRAAAKMALRILSV